MNRRPNQVASIEPGLVLELGDRPLDPAPERRLDPDVGDADPGADDGPLLDEPQVAELAHLAEVVVATRQVEEELADGQEAEPAAGPLEEVGGAEPRAVEHRVEQLGRIGRAAAGAQAPSASSARRRAGEVRRVSRSLPYSAEIR